jgi:hyperosmotically inducible protein
MLVCATCLTLPACAASSARPASSAAAMDDATITARVKTVLLNDTQVAATKIDVSTTNGVVTMSGTVKSKADEARAIELARRVGGVRDVKSTLQISGSSLDVT